MSKVLYKERRDTGEMFDATIMVEDVGAGRFRASVAGGMSGGIQCFRKTPEEAKAEIPRLFEKFFGMEY
jgi:hypothetical protein